MQTIVTGIYGSGKTEFCLNYALSLPKPVKLADMDVVNPYFRSREKADFLATQNIQVIGNLTDNSGNQDLPAISGEVIRAVLAKDTLVVDLAGSALGLHALSLFKKQLNDYRFWAVINAFRADSSTAEKARHFIQTAESVSGLKINGIINNSHMLRETAAEHVLHGQALAVEVLKSLDIPIVYTFLKDDIYTEIKDQLASPALTFNKLIMREDWQ